MNPANLLFLGVKNSVTALSRIDGTIVWTTQLKKTGLGGDFVTLHIDGLQVFAHSSGELYCLELSTGRILWNNPLKGLGYGIATLATQDVKANLTAAQAQLIAAQQAAATSAAHPSH
jgi:outer membrane protein assembly factor BamB